MIEVIWGSAKEKPISSKSLAEELSANLASDGYLYLGYPIIGSPTGPMKLDALLAVTDLRARCPHHSWTVRAAF